MATSTSVVGTVCTLCRQRKIKCDRRMPACTFCLNNGFQCEYIASSKKPGLRAGYVRQLEGTIEALQRRFTNLESKLAQEKGTAVDTTSDPSSSGRLFEQGTNELVSSSPTQPQGQHIPRQAFIEAGNLWFQRYHKCFPILHAPSTLEPLQSKHDNAESPVGVLLKALTVFVLPDLSLYQPEARQRWALSMRKEIILEAFMHLSLPALQAMLILSLHDLGQGNIAESWNSVALCRRMSVSLGLRDLVVNYCANFGQSSLIPPRMLTIPDDVIGFEERIRAFWAAEVLDSASTIGTAWNFGISRPELTGCTPSADDVWQVPEGQFNMFPFGSSEAPSAFSLYARLVNNELWHIHELLQQPADMSLVEVRNQRRTDVFAIDQRLLQWRSVFQNLANATSPASGIFAPDESRHEDPNVILSYCTLDSSTIALYQRLVPCSADSTGDSTGCLWNHAANRCLQCCDQLTQTIRNLPDDVCERMNPQLIICIFVAARFYVIYARLTMSECSPKLSLLRYTLKLLAPRWRLAYRLDEILSAATQRISTTTVDSSTPLPEQFYDPQYAWPDIDQGLCEWAEKHSFQWRSDRKAQVLS